MGKAVHRKPAVLGIGPGVPCPYFVQRARKDGHASLWQSDGAAGVLMASVDPAAGGDSLTHMALAAVLLGFSSVTQDIVIDAYRIESAEVRLQALLSSTYIAGYRVGMVVAGAGALFLAANFGATSEAYGSATGSCASSCSARSSGRSPTWCSDGLPWIVPRPAGRRLLVDRLSPATASAARPPGWGYPSSSSIAAGPGPMILPDSSSTANAARCCPVRSACWADDLFAPRPASPSSSCAVRGKIEVAFGAG